MLAWMTGISDFSYVSDLICNAVGWYDRQKHSISRVVQSWLDVPTITES